MSPSPPQNVMQEEAANDNSSETMTPVVLPAAAEDIESENSIIEKPAAQDIETEKTTVEKPLPTPPSKTVAEHITPPVDGALEQESESNTFSPIHIDLKNVKANTLSPKEQEAQDEEMRKGIHALFNNKFSMAKAIFEAHAKEDPLHALGLGAMAFMKAITSTDAQDVQVAIATLTETYDFADAQIDAASCKKKPLKDTVASYLTNFMTSNSTGLPTNTRPLSQEELKDQHQFLPNGVLRAHVIKAECSLLMAIIHLTQETVMGYLKMGLNLRRAYNSYSLVWHEYKCMGQDFNKYMDPDTVSAIQFGIGSVHLLRASLPPKILKIIASFGWQSDKQLGFVLLKLCLESKRIRSPLASMMLLTYYIVLTSHAPLILSQDLMQPAVECLLDAQQSYANSAFFLYFAGRVSRLTHSIPLSTQSFRYTYEVSQGEWAETTMGQLANYEIAFNLAMDLAWSEAASTLSNLVPLHARPAFVRYFYGACKAMMMGGEDHISEAILAFAEAPKLVEHNGGQIEQFVCHRVAFFEQSGYQDLELSLPALEILLLWNLFACMADEKLEKCFELVDETLNKIYQRERQEYEIRNVEIAPSIPLPDYYDHRAALLLIKVSILNALGRGREAIPHINWVLDNRARIIHCKWVVPFMYWEAGVTCWVMENYVRARSLWESALGFSGYPFEYRLAVRLNLAITHANDLNVPSVELARPEKGFSTQGRKRMSLASSKSSSSPPDSPATQQQHEAKKEDATELDVAEATAAEAQEE